MISNSTDNSKPWIATDHERRASVEIRLLKRTFVFPWSQFLYAEGNSDEIQVFFATHEVVVRAAGLVALITDLSDHRVTLLPEPVRTDRFGTEPKPRITSVSVRKVE